MLVAAPLIFLTWGYLSFFTDTSTTPSNTGEPHKPSGIEMYVQAQEFVRQGLKAPSTARFPGEASYLAADGSGLYQVTGYVDAENSFGAPLRNEWAVTMWLVGDKWVLDKMIIGGRLIYDSSKSE